MCPHVCLNKFQSLSEWDSDVWDVNMGNVVAKWTGHIVGALLASWSANGEQGKSVSGSLIRTLCNTTLTCLHPMVLPNELEA
jgi:hypothetical protein